MSKGLVRFDIDEAALKELNQVLATIPGRFRGKAAMQALKKSGKPLLDAVKEIAAQEVKSKSLPKSYAWYNGKHARKGGDPYIVLLNRNKKYPHRRNNDGFSSIGETNWKNVAHLVHQGTNAGPRRAGTSVRQERAGRDRIKLFKMSGEPAYVRRPTRGRYFIVTGADGRTHPLKTISHPGTNPTRIYEKATRKGARPATDKFAEFARDEVARIRTRLLKGKGK